MNYKTIHGTRIGSYSHRKTKQRESFDGKVAIALLGLIAIAAVTNIGDALQITNNLIEATAQFIVTLRN